MYECPNCAGNLKFDISRQQLFCEYCGTQVDPYGYEKKRDAQEAEPLSEEYEVTVFTCPQCGGEILSEDTTAVTFCSFCGASTILDNRIGRERRPGYIIPFTRTREDCRAAYGKMLRRAIFAPKALKDEALIEKFRGIYMPYWVYSFEKREPITFTGKKNYRRGDYVITDHYRLDCAVEEDYRGLAYDASATFSDSLSNAIAPFDLRQGKAFTPSFLSGFYADTSDVEKYVYLPDAEEVVIQDAVRCLSRNSLCRKYQVGRGGDRQTLQGVLRPSGRKAELAMLPVWFLSYRNGDRVSYAVVNGQTGKAAADLPVDRKRYLTGSLLLAIPLFFLLNVFFTITPGKILLIAALLAFVCILISNGQLSHILARESGEDDKGKASQKPAAGIKQPVWGEKEPVRKTGSRGTGKIIVIVLLIYVILTVFYSFLYFLDNLTGGGMRNIRIVSGVAVPLLLIGGIQWRVASLRGNRRGQKSPQKAFGGGHFRKKLPVLCKPFAGIMAALLIWLINPVSDIYYYIGAFACMGTVLWAIMDIIRQHNLLTTRKLPQLNRRGGDEGA